MPFYLAIPRSNTFSGSTQRGTLTKAEYVRTQPSSLIYQLGSGYSFPLKAALYQNMALLAHIINEAPSGMTTTIPFVRRAFFYRPIKMDQIPFLHLPKIQIQFTGKPDENDIAKLDAMGATTVKIKGAVKDTHTVRPTSYDHLSELMPIKHVDSGFRPTEDAISVPQINAFLEIFTRIINVAELLEKLSPFNDTRVGFVIEANGTPITIPGQPEESAPTETVCSNPVLCRGQANAL